MQIKKINIYGFGKFTNQSFTVDPQLQVFYGLNEAGKSTIRQFVFSILFGYASNRANEKALRYKPKVGNAYGGNLEVEYQGHDYRIERLDGKNGGQVTITDLKNNEQISEDFLKTILGPIDQQTYQQLFGFNQTDLSDLSKLNQNDLQRKIIQMGAVGSDSWIELQDQFESESDKLFTPKGRVKPLNKLLKQYDDLSKKLRDMKKQLPSYFEYQKTSENLDAQIKQVRNEQSEVTKKLNQTKILLSKWDAYVELSDLEKQHVEEARSISETDMNQVRQSFTRWQQLKKQSQETKEKVDLIQVEQQKQLLPDNASEIIELDNQSNTVNDLIQSQKKLKNDIEETKAGLDELNQKYQFDLDTLSPLSDEEITIVRNDQRKLKENSWLVGEKQTEMLQQPQTKDNNLVSIVLGVGGVIALVLPISLPIKILLALILFGVAVWLFWKNGQNSPQNNIQDEIDSLKQEASETENNLNQVKQSHQMNSVALDDMLLVNNDVEKFKNLHSTYTNLTNQLSENNGILDEFWNRFTRLYPDKEQKGTESIDFLNQQVDKIRRIKEQDKNNQTRLDYLRNELEQSLQNQSDESASIEAVMQVRPEQEQFEDLLKQKQNQQKVLIRIQELKNQVDTTELEQLREISNKSELESQLNSEQEQLTNLNSKEKELLDSKTEQIGNMTGQISSGDVEQTEQDLIDLQQEITDDTEAWLTQKLSVQWIEKTLELATQGRLPKVVELAQKYFKQLTESRYESFTLEKKRIETKRVDGVKFDLNELSRGTAEQLYVSLRLAFTEVVSDIVKLPIIIDDGFVSFDDQRLKIVFEILSQISVNNQIIYFTAKTEVEPLVDQKRIIRLE
ncbi:AAA family ATPase [Pediococcus argentinicus]|uniref:ATP-binding protein n=1 Tax=Pediococcus argentinicus TaxID=480391 RepID=UPI00338DCB73